MLTSRARRRSQEADGTTYTVPARQRTIVNAFLAASREGDFDALVALLHPDAVLRSDQAAAQIGTKPELRSAASIAQEFSGRAQAARPALIDGRPGAAWAPGGKLRGVFMFTTTDDTITAINVCCDPEYINQLEVEFLTNTSKNPDPRT